MKAAWILLGLVGCAETGVPAGDDADAAAGVDAPAVDAADVDAARGFDSGTGDAAAVDAASPDAAPACTMLGAQAIELGQAASSGEHVLRLTARSASPTRWSELGNEAVVLEILVAGERRGHLVLHQGAVDFGYAMHVGQLEAGQALSARVSPLSAANATPAACVSTVELAVSNDPALLNAPIFRWPVQKRFDDLPVVVGYSAAKATYQAVYTSENGGTVVSCGGGADGMQAEIARWGRSVDIEDVLSPSGWGRCTGRSQNALRKQAGHSILYYGDGHNRLFEHRGGYGQSCGSGGAEKADGNLAGWNSGSPGTGEAEDGPFVIELRPLPVDLDALGYASFAGRREALLDAYAAWVYRLSSAELAREGKIDGSRTREMDEYLYVDVHAADVDGSGDCECSLSVSKGFVLRVLTSDGVTLDGPQMTASYFGAAEDVKRIAIPLDRAREPAEITGLVFDAYDKDGMYLLGAGPIFLVRAEGDNGASLVHLREAESPVNVYVDDDQSSCVGGVNDDGPGGFAYPCTGSDHSFAP